MISAYEARQIILEQANPLGAEKIPLEESLHRHLASRIVAPINLPVFDNAAMDGFALRSGDTRKACREAPVKFRIVGSIAAGDSFSKINSGESSRIMTGAPIPEGADTVVPFEESRTENDFCLLSAPVTAGENIRRAGEDVRRGDAVLELGELVSSRTIALLAALGVTQVNVFKKPRVRILSTGSEIIEAGQPLPPGKIYNSNGPAITAALLKMMGAVSPLRSRRIAIAEKELKGSKGKEDYPRGIVDYREGHYFARSAGVQGSAHLLSLACANAFLIIPEGKMTIAAGELIEVEFLTEDL